MKKVMPKNTASQPPLKQDDKLDRLEALIVTLRNYAHGKGELPTEHIFGILSDLEELVFEKRYSNRQQRRPDTPFVEGTKIDAVSYALHCKAAGLKLPHKAVADAFGLRYDPARHETPALKNWIRKFEGKIDVVENPSEELLSKLEMFMKEAGWWYQGFKPAGTGNRSKPVNKARTS